MTRPIATLSLVMFAAHFAIPPAAAQYPTRPIHLIVPAAPGGGTDIAARSFVPALQDNLGQAVVIETHPSVPASTLAEFIAYPRERSGKLSYATDPGSAGFLAGELFKQMAGVKVEYIPYKGSGPAAADVVAGHVPYMWSVISIATPYVKGGRLKALAIAAERRAPNLPEVPTTAEGGMPDFVVSGWYGLLAPAKTPKAVIDRVHAAAAKALQNEAVLARLATSGSLPIGAGPEQLDAHIRREIARWEKVLKAAGVELK